MRARTKMALLALPLLLGVGGCNWTSFSDLAEDAPVRAIGAPSGFDSSDFGKSITPLSNGQGSAAAFIATSLNDTHVVVVTIDASGNVKSSGISAANLSETESSAITSVAEIPSDTTTTTVLMGSPVVRDEDFGRVYTYMLPDPASPVDDQVKTLLIPALGSGDSGLGRGLATGYLDGVVATPDYVVGSDNEIAVVVDGVVATTALGTTTVGVAPLACDVSYDATQDNQYFVHRPILSTRLWADPRGPSVQQLFVGAPHGTGTGTVSVMNSVNGALTCLASIAGPKAEFGHALAAGDADGDGVADFLVVGSPGQQAFVYPGWDMLPAGTVPAALPIAPTPAGVNFGFAVLALNVDGLPGDEVLVSDPRATVGGKANAGHILVYKYNLAMGVMNQVGEITNHSPSTDANFGYTLNALNFCQPGAAAAGEPCSRILLVGAANEVFVYFRMGDHIPMQAGQTVADVRAP